MTIFLMSPASASSETQYVQKANFWHWLGGEGSILHDFAGYYVGAVCPDSEDGYHHASSFIEYAKKEGYYRCICNDCGREFTAYEGDLQQSYDNQVSELPASGISSNGRLIWQPTVSDLDSEKFFFGSSSLGRFKLSAFPVDYNGYISFSFLENLNGFFIDWYGYKGSTFSPSVYGIIPYKVPIPGTYFSLPTLEFDGYAVTSSGDTIEIKVYYPEKGSHYNPNITSDFQYNDKYILGSSAVKVIYARANLYFPVYEIIPDTAIDPSTDTIYNITTRPTSITGNYGIIGDNGQITAVEDNSTIVNETNNTYYNPATGTTSPITDWSYNYADRSYTVTTESGDTVTVTYGDENITIKEGDTTYNVYYISSDSSDTPVTPPSPSPVPTPTPCVHVWSDETVKPATCTMPGSTEKTCTLCGETKITVVTALGHDWQIKQTVNTEYDDTGQLVQEGYTIFECSRCGDQAKTTDGSTPPSGVPPESSGDSGGIFSGIFGLLVDFLSFFWNTFKDFVGSGVKGFLKALMDGTSDIFGLLNPFEWGS